MPPRKRSATADRLAAVAGPSAPPFAPEMVGQPHPMADADPDDAHAADDAAAASTQPRPVRMTVVLGPVEYDRLQAFTHEAQEGTGRRGVAASEVTRLALARVLGDPALRAELRETIKREGGNRRRERGKRTRT